MGAQKAAKNDGEKISYEAHFFHCRYKIGFLEGLFCSIFHVLLLFEVTSSDWRIRWTLPKVLRNESSGIIFTSHVWSKADSLLVHSLSDYIQVLGLAPSSSLSLSLPLLTNELLRLSDGPKRKERMNKQVSSKLFGHPLKKTEKTTKATFSQFLLAICTCM